MQLRQLIISFLPPAHPAFFVHLAPPRYSQSAGRNILGDAASRSNIGPSTDAYGRHKLGIGADKGVVLDNSSIFANAVEIACYRARPDIHVAPDGGVSEIGQ